MVVAVLADVEHLDDVRMAKLGDDPRFAMEPSHHIGFLGEIGAQHLQGKDRAQFQVANLVDQAHAAPAQFPYHFILSAYDHRFRRIRVSSNSPPNGYGGGDPSQPAGSVKPANSG